MAAGLWVVAGQRVQLIESIVSQNAGGKTTLTQKGVDVLATNQRAWGIKLPNR